MAEQIDLTREAPFALGSLRVDPPLRRVSTGETLEPRVMMVLVRLAQANGAVVSRDDLIQSCWDGRIVGEDSVTRVIGRLRRLSEEAGAGSFEIETVPKTGYRLVGGIAPIEEPPEKPIGEAAGLPEAAPAVPRPRLVRWWWIALLLAVAALVAVAVWRGRQPPPVTVLSFAGFEALDQGVPQGLARVLDETTLTAFNTDGKVRLARPGKPAGGDYQLGGTISETESGLRISARIENRASGALIWSRMLEQPVARVGKLPGWAASQVSQIARCAFDTSSAPGDALDDAAMELVFAVCDAEADGRIELALDHARRLTGVAPELAGGWAARAWMANGRAFAVPPGQRAAMEAEATDALRRALALNPRDPRARHVAVYMVPPGDLVGTEKAFREALDGWPATYGDYANFLRGVGRGAEARHMLERASDAAPLSPVAYIGLSILDAAEGRTQETTRGLAGIAALEMDEKRLTNHSLWIAPWTGNYAEALAILPRSNVPAPLLPATTAAFQALQSGDEAARQAAARGLADAVEACGCGSALQIRLRAALGDSAGALEAIAATPEPMRIGLRGTLVWDPLLEEARHLPAFGSIAQQWGMVDYWRATATKPDFCRTVNAPPLCQSL